MLGFVEFFQLTQLQYHQVKGKVVFVGLWFPGPPSSGAGREGKGEGIVTGAIHHAAARAPSSPGGSELWTGLSYFSTLLYRSRDRSSLL